MLKRPCSHLFKITFEILLVAAGLMLAAPGIVDARLIVYPPEKALQTAELIITGTVTERNFEETRRSVTLRVDEVLKGQFKKDELTLEMKKNFVYGWPGFDFPEPEKKIFLLLRGDSGEGYWLAQGLNSVALLENDHVTSLYNGSDVVINDRHWSKGEYAYTYDAFYQNHKIKQVGKPKPQSVITLAPI